MFDAFIPPRVSLAVLYCAMGLYAANLIVGVVAFFGRISFGRFHHYLYFAVFVLAGLAAVLRFSPPLLITLICLAVLPRFSPRGWKHPTAAVLGMSGYVISLLLT